MAAAGEAAEPNPSAQAAVFGRPFVGGIDQKGGTRSCERRPLLICLPFYTGRVSGKLWPRQTAVPGFPPAVILARPILAPVGVFFSLYRKIPVDKSIKSVL